MLYSMFLLLKTWLSSKVFKIFFILKSFWDNYALLSSGVDN